jgi:hypothetical protein
VLKALWPPGTPHATPQQVEHYCGHKTTGYEGATLPKGPVRRGPAQVWFDGRWLCRLSDLPGAAYKVCQGQ